MMPHGFPCRVLVLSTSQDHEADVLEDWQQHQTSLSQGNWPCEIIHFTFSRSVHRSRSAHTTRPSGPRSRGIFFCGMPVAPRRFSRTAAHADQVAASRAGRLVSQGHSNRQRHQPTRRINSKVRSTGVVVPSAQSCHGTDHT